MYSFLTLTFLLLWNASPSQPAAEVTYQELQELDAVCPKLDTCSVRRQLDSLDKYTCHCGNYCSRLDTCCIDSRYTNRRAITSRRKPVCKSINGDDSLPYFVIDYCPASNKDSVFNKMCKQDWQEDSNLMSLVPVTSLSSNHTYKNYYCLQCHESTEDFLYWQVKINSIEMSEGRPKDVEFTYDRLRHTWMASVGTKNNLVPVTLFFEIPEDVKALPKVCVADAISRCSSHWKIRDVIRKCAVYTSFIYVLKDGEKVLYRNPHCALCNYESLENMGCFVQSSKRATERRPFSFTYLLDINRKDGDKVGKIQRCDEDSEWDPFFKKCRILTCALPGHSIKDGKCVPP